MFCPECGHQNPADNKFCGMCGERLPDRSGRPVPGKDPTGAEVQAEDTTRATERQERIAELDPEPVPASWRHREPVDATIREAALPAAVADFYASRNESEPPTEAPTTLSGPSFLGLSGSGDGESYSYLYEDEQPQSHAGSLVFLLLLIILAAAVYWKWQPIRDYVVNAALTHSQQGRSTAPAAAPTEPGSTTASTDNAAPQPAKPADAKGLPQQDNATAPEPKVETTQPKDQAEPAPKGPDKTSTPKDERPRSEVGRPSQFQDVKGKGGTDEDAPAESEKPSARAPAKAAGADLVDMGERYLYGRGASRNCSQALVNFNAAAKQENPKAMSHLGSLYATGQCVPLDRAQAYQWFSRALAADRSNTYIEHNLNMLWRDMSSTERAKATQKRMF